MCMCNNKIFAYGDKNSVKNYNRVVVVVYLVIILRKSKKPIKNYVVDYSVIFSFSKQIEKFTIINLCFLGSLSHSRLIFCMCFKYRKKGGHHFLPSFLKDSFASLMLIQKMFVKCVKSKTSLALIQFFVQLIQKCSFVVGVFYSLLYTILQKNSL